MNGSRNPQQQRSQRSKPPPQNAPSVLLNDQENRVLYGLLGKKCVTMATGVAQVFLANGTNGQWTKTCTGVCCFVKDNSKRSYFIRVYSLKKGLMMWEQEMYNEFEYAAPRSYFLTFDTSECRAALNFASEPEAEKFRKILDDKIRAKRENRRGQRKISAPPVPVHKPPPAHHHHHHHPTTGLTVLNAPAAPSPHEEKKSKKSKKNKNNKLKKTDISSPSNFTHVTHVGWDPNKGFDMNQVDPSYRELFASCGITEKDLADREKVEFIYDFIEKQGGRDAVQKDIERRESRRPPPAPPSSQHHHAQPPPPPPPRQADNSSRIAHHHHRAPPKDNSRGPPPPPPPRQPASNIPLPPPPPPANIPAPPPANIPPPPPPGGCIPPPPPISSGNGLPPPPPAPAMPSGRGDLLAQIREGNPGLKPASTREIKPVAAAPADGRDALLESIRNFGGNKLKPVEEQKKRSPTPSESESCGGGGLASALMLALANRDKIIHPDSGDDSVADDDSDEWD